MQQSQMLVALITAGSTVIAAVVTGFGAAALKNRWDRREREETWAWEARNRRREEVLRAYEAEVRSLMYLEQLLWHPGNRELQIDDLDPELSTLIRENMRTHGSTFAAIELLGSNKVLEVMEEANARLVATFVHVSRNNLEDLRTARLQLSKAMREDVELPPVPDKYRGGKV